MTATKIKQYLNVEITLRGHGLNSDDKLAYSFLCDRMKSSILNPAFYDPEQLDSYVICTRDQLADFLEVSPRTAGTVLAHLEATGYIKRVAQPRYRTKKIFLPKYTAPDKATKWDRDIKFKLNGKICRMVGQHLHTNHLNLITYVGSTVYTVNTKAINWHSQKSQPVNPEPKPKSQPKITYTTSPIELWKSGTASKMRIPENALDVIGDFVDGDVDQARAIVRTLSIARTFVAKDAGITGQPEARFESNQRFQSELSGKLRVLFGYIKQKGYTNYMGYLNKSLTTWFKDVMGLVADTPTVTKRAPHKQNVVETIPDYLKDDYVAPKQDPELTAQRNAEFKERLASLKARSVANQ